MYGSNSSRSIAIDDISILSESCILQPNQLHEYGGRSLYLNLLLVVATYGKATSRSLNVV